MSLIESLSQVIGESKKELEKIQAGEFKPVEIYEGKTDLPAFDSQINYRGNRLALGDNLAYMKNLLDSGWKGKFKLIYIDPPFFSKNNYQARLKTGSGGESLAICAEAFEDKWHGDTTDYLRMLTLRLMLMKELLAPEGSIWVHLDWHVVHYVKVIMDEIFGEKNFVNEVIWKYKSGGSSKHHFSRKHDTLLFYKNGRKHCFKVPVEKSYNRGFKPYRFKGVKEYKDDLGWYTMVNMKDVWEIDMVGRTSAERTGYATQKPEALLDRIVEACTEPGDFCGDFFCGAGTLAAVAQKKERNWVCCDMSSLAVSATEKRIVNEKGSLLLEHQTGIESKETKNFEALWEVSVEDVAVSDIKKVTVEFKGWKGEPGNLPLMPKDKEKVEAMRIAKPAELLDYWSLDFGCNGAIQNAGKTFVRTGGHVETKYTMLAEEVHDIGLRAVDIFGNQHFKVIKARC